jgi:hypothetical protein
MPFDWACDHCGWPNEPGLSVCAHCGADRTKNSETTKGSGGYGRGKKAGLIFLGVEAWGLIVYMIGIRATIAGLSLASAFLVLALTAALITYVRFPRG